MSSHDSEKEQLAEQLLDNFKLGLNSVDNPQALASNYAAVKQEMRKNGFDTDDRHNPMGRFLQTAREKMRDIMLSQPSLTEQALSKIGESINFKNMVPDLRGKLGENLTDLKPYNVSELADVYLDVLEDEMGDK
jgi:hypothetical protein